MLAFIEGTVCEKSPDQIILEKNGMGYILNYDPAYAGRMPALGQCGRIFTHLHVREDELSLYAFPAYEDKQLFELLLTVSGIGPKAAGALAAQLGPGRFALAVLNGDVKSLTMVKGVGKKSAERLILELKDKLASDQSFLPEDSEALPETGLPADASVLAETESALLVLGYSRGEARKALQTALSKQPETAEVDALLRLALKELAVI